MSGTHFEAKKRPLVCLSEMQQAVSKDWRGWQHQNLPKVRRGLNQKARAAEL